MAFANCTYRDLWPTLVFFPNLYQQIVHRRKQDWSWLWLIGDYYCYGTQQTAVMGGQGEWYNRPTEFCFVVWRHGGDVTLHLLLLGASGVVVSSAPARVQLHVEFLLLPRHLVVLGLLRPLQCVPLSADNTSTLALSRRLIQSELPPSVREGLEHSKNLRHNPLSVNTCDLTAAMTHYLKFISCRPIHVHATVHA